LYLFYEKKSRGTFQELIFTGFSSADYADFRGFLVTNFFGANIYSRLTDRKESVKMYITFFDLSVKKVRRKI
jgi:hypothetical protein